MANVLLCDNGGVSGVTGFKLTSDTSGALDIKVGNGSVTAMSVTAAGNVGVGVTPSAWGYTAVQLPSGSMYSHDSTTDFRLLSNAYYAAGNTPKYATTAAAAMSRMEAGSFYWYTAASGTAGNAITFTDVMALNEMGQWSVTKATNQIGAVVNIKNTHGTYQGSLISGDTTRAATAAFDLISLRANGVQQFVVLGTGTVYAQNTTIQSLSDGRLKENVRDSQDGLSVINALRPVRYDWKSGFGNDRKNQLGFIAQEVEPVFPDAVSEWTIDEEVYKTVGPGALIPVLVKAVQELYAEVAALKGAK